MTPKGDAEKYAGWLNKAMDGYQYVFKKYLKTLLPLEEGDFWQIQHFFSRLVICSESKFISSNLGYSVASTHLFDNSTENRPGSKRPKSIVKYTTLDAIRFARTWPTVEEKARRLLLINNLPIIYAESLLFTDKNFFLQLAHSLIKTEVDLEEQLEEFGEEHYGNKYFWIQFNGNGTHTVGERLEAAARCTFARITRDSRRDESVQASGPTEKGCENPSRADPDSELQKGETGPE